MAIHISTLRSKMGDDFFETSPKEIAYLAIQKETSETMGVLYQYTKEIGRLSEKVREAIKKYVYGTGILPSIELLKAEKQEFLEDFQKFKSAVVTAAITIEKLKCTLSWITPISLSSTDKSYLRTNNYPFLSQLELANNKFAQWHKQLEKTKEILSKDRNALHAAVESKTLAINLEKFSNFVDHPRSQSRSTRLLQSITPLIHTPTIPQPSSNRALLNFPLANLARRVSTSSQESDASLFRTGRRISLSGSESNVTPRSLTLSDSFETLPLDSASSSFRSPRERETKIVSPAIKKRVTTLQIPSSTARVPRSSFRNSSGERSLSPSSSPRFQALPSPSSIPRAVFERSRSERSLSPSRELLSSPRRIYVTESPKIPSRSLHERIPNLPKPRLRVPRLEIPKFPEPPRKSSKSYQQETGSREVRYGNYRDSGYDYGSNLGSYSTM